MKQRSANWLAFLTVPVVPPLVGFLSASHSESYDLITVLAFAAVAYLFSAMVTALIGIPIFLVLLKRRLVSWWSAILVGVAVGCLIGLLLQLSNAEDVLQIAQLSLEGAVSGFVFWIIWKQGQNGSPDSHTKADRKLEL